eukprot:2430827-Rhodomonas_salina.2
MEKALGMSREAATSNWLKAVCAMPDFRLSALASRMVVWVQTLINHKSLHTHSGRVTSGLSKRRALLSVAQNDTSIALSQKVKEGRRRGNMDKLCELADVRIMIQLVQPAMY